MAEKKSIIKQDLSRSTKEVIDRLFKLHVVKDDNFPENYQKIRQDWVDDVYDLLHSVPMMKSTGTFPTADQIYQWTYDKYQDLVSYRQYMGVLLDTISDRWDIDLDEADIPGFLDQFELKCAMYFSWISTRLCGVGIVSLSEVNSKLLELQLGA